MLKPRFKCNIRMVCSAVAMNPTVALLAQRYKVVIVVCHFQAFLPLVIGKGIRVVYINSRSYLALHQAQFAQRIVQQL